MPKRSHKLLPLSVKVCMYCKKHTIYIGFSTTISDIHWESWNACPMDKGGLLSSRVRLWTPYLLRTWPCDCTSTLFSVSLPSQKKNTSNYLTYSIVVKSKWDYTCENHFVKGQMIKAAIIAIIIIIIRSFCFIDSYKDLLNGIKHYFNNQNSLSLTMVTIIIANIWHYPTWSGPCLPI